MSGGLMQLVAIGAQDMYLSYNPEITFFDTAHKTYTNFALESMEQNFSAGAVGWGQQTSTNLARTGDLVNTMYIQLELPKLVKSDFITAGMTGTEWDEFDSVAWTNCVGHAAINYVQLTIGGVPIDKHYGRWLHIWDELTCKAEHFDGVSQMVGRHPDEDDLKENGKKARTLYVPLKFWFNRNVGAALPLVALQFHDVSIKIELNNLNALVVFLDTGGYRCTGAAVKGHKVDNNVAPLSKCTLYVDYIYLDNEERQRFARDDHMYLVEQLQFNGQESVNDWGAASEKSIVLNFNHPTKEILWTAQLSDNYKEGPAYNDWFNYSSAGPGRADADGYDLLGTAQLRLNSHDRFSPARQASYFRLVQPANHHTRIPTKNIYCYSFALNPEEYQPSGTCNFSRIDNARLMLTSAKTEKLQEQAPGGGPWSEMQGRYEVWAWSLNQLKVSGGLGGLQFAN